MDLITQGLAGAVLAAAAAPAPQLRRAAVIGAVAGMLPDADILIRSADDPLFNLEYHRHFSHALVFVPVGALLAALAFRPFLRGRLGLLEIWAFAMLGMLSAGLLDACTSFGTHLLWPFSDQRIAWNLIAIVDPLFSLALAAGLVLAWRRQSVGSARVGLGLVLLYLGLALVQQQRVEDAVIELARERGHAIKRMEVKPTLGNIVLWRSVYLAGDQFHVAAVRAGFSTSPQIYHGGAVLRFRADLQAGLPPHSVQAQDIARFSRLSDDYLVSHPQRPEIIGDLRYAMLPNGTAPLWGIAIDPDEPDRHVEFVTLRDASPEVRRAFLAMLRGTAPETIR